MNPASQPDAAWLSLPPKSGCERSRPSPCGSARDHRRGGAGGEPDLAVLILAGFAYSYGVDRTPAVVGAVVEGGAAAKAGLRAGDRIVALDGRGVDTFSDLARYALIRRASRSR